MKRALGMVLFVSLLFGMAGADAAMPLRIGILAVYPAAQETARWQALADYLQRRLPDQRFEVMVGDYETLEAAVGMRSIDFVFTDPAHYLFLQHSNGVGAALVTLVNEEEGKGVQSLGGVMLVDAGRSAADSLHELAHRVVAVPDRRLFAGFLAQQYELKRAGIACCQVIESGLPDESALEALLAGRADAAFVRSGVVERMVREGRLDAQRVKVLNRQNLPDLPFAVSTHLYPEWPLAALPHVREEQAIAVAAALLQLPHHGADARSMGIQGFTTPASYLPVEEVLRTLRVAPFDVAPDFTWADVWHRYSAELILLFFFIAIIVLLSFVLVLWNRRLHASQQLNEARRIRLENVLEGTRAGAWEWNVQNGELHVNPRWAEIIGHTVQELQPLTVERWEKLIHPEDIPLVKSLLQQHFAGENPYYECELRLRHKDGHWVWVHDRGKVIRRTADGRPVMMYGTHIDISQRKDYENELYRRATTDYLTGLANRRHFIERLESELARIGRIGGSAVLLMLDLDHFKQINDAHGHAAGDAVLQRFAQTLKDQVRQMDVAGRMGGEEFCILLPGTDCMGASEFAERLRQRVEADAIEFGQQRIRYSVSIGIACVRPGCTGADALLSCADQALYRAKEAGRNRVVISDECGA